LSEYASFSVFRSRDDELGSAMLTWLYPCTPSPSHHVKCPQPPPNIATMLLFWC